MASPQDSALNIGITVDTKEGEANVKNLAKAFVEVEQEAKRASESAVSFSDVIGGIGKIASGAFGIVTAALKAPIDLDNYLGNLNQKVTQIGGQLDRYKAIAVEFRTHGFFKPGEGGFGLEEEDYNKIMKQFATGTAAIEKYGATTAKSNVTGFTQGAGMLMKTLGFDPNQASLALTDLHKTIGLTFAEMPSFTKEMGNIGKNANLSAGQMANLVGQVSHLAKAYGMGSKQAKSFVLESIAVGSAISQLGLNVQDTLAKMNQVSEGSEEGLIQSILLGFKPGDQTGTLAAFQNQAKMLVAQAKDAGEQFGPYIMRAMADSMGMKGFTNEQIQRLAGGATIEGSRGPQQQDATSILKDILKETRKQGRAEENPYITVAQKYNDVANHFRARMIELMDQALRDLKTLADKIPGYIDTAIGWFQDIRKFMGGWDLSLKNISLAAMGLLALPKVLAALPGAIGSSLGWLAKIGMRGATTSGQAIVGSAAHLLPAEAVPGLMSQIAAGGLTSIIAASVAVLGAAAVGVAVGTLINQLMPQSWKDKIGDFFVTKDRQDTSWLDNKDKAAGKYNRDVISEKYASEIALRQKAMGDPSRLTQTQKDTILMDVAEKYGLFTQGTSAQKAQQGLPQSYSSDPTGLHKFVKDKGWTIPPHGDMTGDHAPNSKHYSGNAVDIRTKDKNDTEIQNMIREAQQAGFYVLDESKDKAQPHLHLSTTPEKGSVAGTLTQANTGGSPSGGLTSVHDATANATLLDIKSYLMQVLHATPALAGSPTSNDDNAENAEKMANPAWSF